MDLKEGIRIAIREEMRRRDITQQILGKMTNIDPAVVSKILSGKRSLTLDNAPLLCSAVGLDFSDVVSGIYNLRIDNEQISQKLIKLLSKEGAGAIASANLERLQGSIKRILKDLNRMCIENVDAKAVRIRVKGDRRPLLSIGEWAEGLESEIHEQGEIEALAQRPADGKWFMPLMFGMRELNRLLTG